MPYLTQFATPDGATLNLRYEKSLLPDAPNKSIYKATLTVEPAKPQLVQPLEVEPAKPQLVQPRTVVVKYAPTYSSTVHKALARLSPPLAPHLYYCEKLKDLQLYVVIMDYVQKGPSQPRTKWTKAEDTTVLLTDKQKELLREAVNQLRKQGYVHGDLREPNVILEAEDKLKIIDFDWSGVGGNVRYPPDINQTIDWPTGVKPGARIEMAHDNDWVESLCNPKDEDERSEA